MTCEKFESVIGYHCSPVLMGQKPSNLVSFSKEKIPVVPELTAFYTKLLAPEGLRMEIVCGCGKHYLVLVYRPDMLERFLSQEEVRELLAQDGYPENGTLEEMLAYLKERFRQREDFPHEIGLFLGYPLEDVHGFRKYKGSNCKLSGYWKVYGDVAQAKRTFARYDRCREFTWGQISRGCSISQIVRMKELCA
ncbi:MAG: DUF3793 family protein [Clostridiales bacterium]|nr:DUF3793 family protein [Clostridiales bacterium]